MAEAIRTIEAQEQGGDGDGELVEASSDPVAMAPRGRRRGRGRHGRAARCGTRAEHPSLSEAMSTYGNRVTGVLSGVEALLRP